MRKLDNDKCNTNLSKNHYKIHIFEIDSDFLCLYCSLWVDANFFFLFYYWVLMIWSLFFLFVIVDMRKSFPAASWKKLAVPTFTWSMVRTKDASTLIHDILIILLLQFLIPDMFALNIYLILWYDDTNIWFSIQIDVDFQKWPSPLNIIMNLYP